MRTHQLHPGDKTQAALTERSWDKEEGREGVGEALSCKLNSGKESPLLEERNF